jgi:phosphatidate phosphatase PAH1
VNFTFMSVAASTPCKLAVVRRGLTRCGARRRYLTSRAIGMATSTRSYISDLKQLDGSSEHTLPEGPVIVRARPPKAK